MTDEEKEEVIRKAMWGKYALVCLYSGLSRVFCPHMLGVMNGASTVLAYQFKGESWSSDDIHETNEKNWRNFKIADIDNLRPCLTKQGRPSERWFTHHSYSGNSKGWDSTSLIIPPEDERD